MSDSDRSLLLCPQSPSPSPVHEDLGRLGRLSDARVVAGAEGGVAGQGHGGPIGKQQRLLPIQLVHLTRLYQNIASRRGRREMGAQ